MNDIIMQLNCNFTDAEKESCLPTIDSLIELSNIARMKGILALELETQQMSNILLKTGVLLIVDGTDPAIVKQIIQNLILAEKYSGAQLLDRLLTAEGVLAIQQGENPRIIALKLFSMLGEKYIPLAKEAFSVDGKRMKKYFDFLGTASSRVSLPESAPFETIILHLDNRSFQRVLCDIDMQHLSRALRGCGFNVINKVLDNVSTNLCLQICEDLDSLNFLRNEDILESQAKFIKVYKSLVDTAEIIDATYGK